MADIVDLAIARLEAEKAARIQAKIDAGKAVRRQHPIVTGVLDPERDYDAVTTDEQGREVYPSELSVVITGVVRGEGNGYIAAFDEPDDRYIKTKPAEKLSPRRPPPTPPEPLPSSPRYPVRCTVRGPDPAKDDPGQIIEASYYMISDTLLSVEDSEGCKLGTAPVRPGDDLVAAARAVIRENHGRHGAFYDPIRYRGNLI